MILFKYDINVQELDKSIDSIIVGDILKRKQDECYYKLNNISFDNNEIAYYHFYGFVIKGMKNMKLYFENNFNKFEIYKEKLDI